MEHSLRHLLPALATALLLPSATAAQSSIDFHDTVQFHRTFRADTIDNDHIGTTPFPDSTDLDLDCDSVADIRLKCFKSNLPNLPQAHHIVVRPLAGSNPLELGNLPSGVYLFRLHSRDGMPLGGAQRLVITGE